MSSAADPLRPDRHRVAGQHLAIAGPPVGPIRSDLGQPGATGPAAARAPPASASGPAPCGRRRATDGPQRVVAARAPSARCRSGPPGSRAGGPPRSAWSCCRSACRRSRRDRRGRPHGWRTRASTCPTTPSDSGWVPGMVSLPFAEVATGICSASASATSSAPAPDHRTPPPATITGRAAARQSQQPPSRSGRPAAGRTGGTVANAGSTSGSASVSSVSSWPSLPWICRWTGPGEPVVGDPERLPQHVGEAVRRRRRSR